MKVRETLIKKYDEIIRLFQINEPKGYSIEEIKNSEKEVEKYHFR